MIDYFSFKNPILKLREGFSLKARYKMYHLFEEYCRPCGDDEVLDLGATPDTSLSDSNYFEKLYPWKDKITVASIEDCSNIVKQYNLKGFVRTASGERLPFGDNQFDILFCSAVIEHVGVREKQQFFLGECLRVSKKLFLTTPNRWFPIEMHTGIPLLHWLPWKRFQKLILPIRGGGGLI